MNAVARVLLSQWARHVTSALAGLLGQIVRHLVPGVGVGLGKGAHHWPGELPLLASQGVIRTLKARPVMSALSKAYTDAGYEVPDDLAQQARADVTWRAHWDRVRGYSVHRLPATPALLDPTAYMGSQRILDSSAALSMTLRCDLPIPDQMNRSGSRVESQHRRAKLFPSRNEHRRNQPYDRIRDVYGLDHLDG